ncbi:hypothetical protein N7478_009422 [Penicillium angulare]|uniref:uncharacterized protein n=1 Tax=Penicillium angulare TaxID=116970 RepID=UPI00253FCFFB|nr:uncharacterized protein N7478_009422 [Penicillium angulare]KAJ5266614.1 hypothetical protein N7478_009422 [Penicillium angulare]
MPVIKKGSDALRIDLAAPEDWTFASGDAVIGDVVRVSPIVTSNANLKVFLRGRIQTSRADVGEGNRHSAGNRHNYNALSQRVASEQILLAKKYSIFDGPLHIADDGAPVSWSFTTEITPDPPRTMHGNFDVSYDYLPGSTPSVRGSTPSSSTAWIEYYLEAELRYLERSQSGQTDIERKHTAIYPIVLRHRPLQEFDEFGIDQETFKRQIRGHRLLPEVGLSTNLSMKQRAQQRFGSSKVPEYHFQVEVYTPKIIQLNNPSILPLNMVIIQGDETSDEIKNVPRKAWITTVKLFLDTFIIVKQHGASLGAEYSKPTNSATSFPSKAAGNTSISQDLHLDSVIKELGAFPLEITVGEGTVDLGSLLQLVLYQDGLSMGGRRLQKVSTITPSLDVYNVRYLNWLRVEVSVTVADEKFVLNTRSPVKILAAD